VELDEGPFGTGDLGRGCRTDDGDDDDDEDDAGFALLRGAKTE
jgi:hypothetical protein